MVNSEWQVTDRVMDKGPLILVTNDDGIESPGLLAAIGAVYDLGEVLVVAPRHQQTGAGRSFLSSDGAIHQEHIEVKGLVIPAFSIDGSPAQAVQHGLVELALRLPDLLIAGINYGENVGSGVTISGTVGAVLEGAAFGIPSLAVSLETPIEYHHNYPQDCDFTAAAFFTHLFAQRLLSVALPPDVDALKIEVPQDATEETPWRLTRVSRQPYFYPVPGNRTRLADKVPLNYEMRIDFNTLEEDSDIFALAKERVVAVSPLSLDLTSRVDFTYLTQLLR
jgi:5'-nucleotidase